MKFMLAFAASLISAALVVPTVSQAQHVDIAALVAASELSA